MSDASNQDRSLITRLADMSSGILFCMGLAGSVFYIFYTGDDVDRIGGGLGSLLLLCLGAYAGLGSLQRRLDTIIDEKTHKGDRS